MTRDNSGAKKAATTTRMQVSSEVDVASVIVETLIGISFILLLVVSLTTLTGTLLRFCCFDDDKPKLTLPHVWIYISYVSIITFVTFRIIDSTFTVVMQLYYPKHVTVQNVVTAVQMILIPGNTWLLCCVIFLGLSATNHLIATGTKKIVIWGIYSTFGLLCMIFSILAMTVSTTFEALKDIFNSSSKAATVFSSDRAWMVTTTIALPVHLAANTIYTVLGISFVIYVFHNRLDQFAVTNASKRESTHPLHESSFRRQKLARRKFTIMLWSVAFVEFGFLVGIVLKVIPDVLMGFSENFQRYIVNIFLRCVSEVIPISCMLILLWPYSVHENCIPVVASLTAFTDSKSSRVRDNSANSPYVTPRRQSAYIHTSSTDTPDVGTQSAVEPVHWRTLYDLYSDHVDVNSI